MVIMTVLGDIIVVVLARVFRDALGGHVGVTLGGHDG